MSPPFDIQSFAGTELMSAAVKAGAAVIACTAAFAGDAAAAGEALVFPRSVWSAPVPAANVLVAAAPGPAATRAMANTTRTSLDLIFPSCGTGGGGAWSHVSLFSEQISSISLRDASENCCAALGRATMARLRLRRRADV